MNEPGVKEDGLLGDGRCSELVERPVGLLVPAQLRDLHGHRRCRECGTGPVCSARALAKEPSGELVGALFAGLRQARLEVQLNEGPVVECDRMIGVDNVAHLVKQHDFDGHRAVMEALSTNPNVAQLRRAMYVQDTIHQFESKAHFDNCDFDGGIAYLGQLLAETDRHVSAAQRATDARQRAAAVERAFFALGQGLHAIQDFYAHSDYVERQVTTAAKPTDIPVIRPWRDSDHARINVLRAGGLVSGFVFWGFPQRCPAGSAWHSELAKDSPRTKSGAVVVRSLENLTQYQIAVFLAREASKDFLEDAFRRWPLLREQNGAYVGIDMFIDRRGL